MIARFDKDSITSGKGPTLKSWSSLDLLQHLGEHLILVDFCLLLEVCHVVAKPSGLIPSLLKIWLEQIYPSSGSEEVQVNVPTGE